MDNFDSDDASFGGEMESPLFAIYKKLAPLPKHERIAIIARMYNAPIENMERIFNEPFLESKMSTEIENSSTITHFTEFEIETAVVEPKEPDPDLAELDFSGGTGIEVLDEYINLGYKIALGLIKSLFVFGPSGHGKTFTLLDEDSGILAGFSFQMRKGDVSPTPDNYSDDHPVLAKRKGLSQNPFVGIIPETGEMFIKKTKYDYIVISGHCTPIRMFEIMQEHNGKLIVFDNCDSIIKSKHGIKILKEALDPAGDGTTTWETTATVKSEYAGIAGSVRKQDRKDKSKFTYILPKRFRFTGKVVIISNLNYQSIPPELRSIMKIIELTLTKDELLARINSIAHRVKFRSSAGYFIDVSENCRNNAVDFIKKYYQRIPPDRFDLRTFYHVAMQYSFAERMGESKKEAEFNIMSMLF